MQHITFLSSQKAVCQKPYALGHDFIVVSYEPGESCTTCFSLVMAYNERINKYELTMTLPDTNRVPYVEPIRPMSRFAPVVYVTSLFWITFFVFVQMGLLQWVFGG